jgi:ribosomal-protein-alanine N-acetyltransferase
MISTGRFLMRDFTAGDGRGFRAYHADPRYRALFGSAEAQDGDAEQLLARFAAWAEERPRRNYQLAVVRRDRNAVLVGCCGLRRAAAAARAAEMGLELAPDHWGRFGYAVEIAYAVIEFGFRELGLAEITGPTQSGNARAMRLAEWFGATLAVRRPGPNWMRANGWSEVEWRLRRENWRASRAAQRFGVT